MSGNRPGLQCLSLVGRKWDPLPQIPSLPITRTAGRWFVVRQQGPRLRVLSMPGWLPMETEVPTLDETWSARPASRIPSSPPPPHHAGRPAANSKATTDRVPPLVKVAREYVYSTSSGSCPRRAGLLSRSAHAPSRRLGDMFEPQFQPPKHTTPILALPVHDLPACVAVAISIRPIAVDPTSASHWDVLHEGKATATHPRHRPFFYVR